VFASCDVPSGTPKPFRDARSFIDDDKKILPMQTLERVAVVILRLTTKRQLSEI
jgi:hypothetical protein